MVKVSCADLIDAVDCLTSRSDRTRRLNCLSHLKAHFLGKTASNGCPLYKSNVTSGSFESLPWAVVEHLFIAIPKAANVSGNSAHKQSNLSEKSRSGNVLSMMNAARSTLDSKSAPEVVDSVIALVVKDCFWLIQQILQTLFSVWPPLAISDALLRQSYLALLRIA